MLYKYSVALLLSLVVMSSSYADGAKFPGVVRVTYNTAAKIWEFSGMFNVAKNPAVTTGHVSMINYGNGSFLVNGADSITGTGFSCNITIGSSLMPLAKEIWTGINDQTILFATSTSNANAPCLNLIVNKHSAVSN